jgi:hypothetical protein
MIHLSSKHTTAKGNTIMSQAKTLPQFKELIEAARFSAKSGVDVANMLIEQDGASRKTHQIYLRQQQERAAEIERQIERLERMATFFEQVFA